MFTSLVRDSSPVASGCLFIFSPPHHLVFPLFTANLLTAILAPTLPARCTFLVVAEAMNLREAAYRLGVSERTLRQWIKDGKLAASMSVTEHGRQWEIPESALQAEGQAPEGPGSVQEQPSGCVG
jgi:excisionase family DNA binding protein